MRVAVVGTGVSGLTVAAELATRHDLTVFEAEDWVGGHTSTGDVEEDDFEYRKAEIFAQLGLGEAPEPREEVSESAD